MSPLWLVVIVGALVFGLWLLFARVWTRRSTLRTRAARFSLALAATMISLLAVEIVFHDFVVVSDGFGFTLASKRWMHLHWRPVNSLGYRDLEPDRASLDGRRVLLVVGDSFVAGHGTADYRDRFANVLGGLLGDGWRVRVVARRGWNTRQEARGLRRYPLDPDVVVLSYYSNDIEGAARRAGWPMPSLVRPPPGFLQPFVDHLYSVNWVYWRLVRFRDARAMGAIYRRYIDEIGRHKSVWTLHERELRSLLRAARRRGAERVLVVVFPNLVDPESSLPITSRVVGWMRRRGVETLDLYPRLAGRDTESLVVNRMDAHPSVALHREVARLLYDRLVSEGAVASR